MVHPRRSERRVVFSTLVVPFLLGLSIGSLFFMRSGEKKVLEETVAFFERNYNRTEAKLKQKLVELEEAAQVEIGLKEKNAKLEEAVKEADKAKAEYKKRNSRAEAKIQEKRDKIAELEKAVETADKENAENEKGHKVFEKKLQKKIDELEKAVKSSNKAPESRQLGQCMQEENGFRPIVVTVATQPRTDLLGAFTLPTLMLLAVAHKHHWSLEIMPLEGSPGEKQLIKQVKEGHDIDPQWGSGFVDANHREGYDPVENNRMVHDTLGFFPKITRDVNRSEWISVTEYPPPGEELEKLCRKGPLLEENGILRCKVWLPEWYVWKVNDHDHNIIKRHILENGGFDAFFTKELRQKIRDRYMEKNGHRVTHFSDSTYDVAMHVRRGDEVQATHPDRWIIQPVYATIARRICKEHPDAVIHVFSAGKNADGGFEGIEEAKDVCKTIVYHLDEVEFDTWAHFVAADEFVMSKSTFSYVPCLFAGGKVHYPSDYWFGGLSDFSNFNSQTGELI